MISLFHTATAPHEVGLVLDVLGSGKLVMGHHVIALEHELTEYIDGKGGFVTTASGTDALVLCLESFNCRRRSVIVPAMSFSATYEAVLRAGAEPVVCDVDPETLTPSSLQLQQCIIDTIHSGKSVAAVIIVHLYGWPAYDIQPIRGLCATQGIVLIEDCAHAFGASLEKQMVGTFGDAAAFSFYPTKPLGGIGDGGAAYFPVRGVADTARARRNHGRTGHGQEFPGYNSRLDAVNAAVLRARLGVHHLTHDKRRALAQRYHERGVTTVRHKGKGFPYVYPIFVDDRNGMQARLLVAGIETRVHYDPPISGLPYVKAKCPNAKAAAQSLLSLPCHQGMELEDVDRVCDAISGDRSEAEDLRARLA